MSGMVLKSWWASDIGLVRKSNQDTVGCFPELGLFIVADGMGGHAAGEIASRMAVDVVRKCLGRERRRGDPEAAAASLRAGIELANERIFAAGKRSDVENDSGRMGSTVVVLLLDLETRNAAWAHVGDSRLYRARDGHVELLTADHTRFGNPYLNQSNIPIDLAHTNVLLQAVGTDREVQVTTRCEPVKPGDTFLLCSDGISGLVDASVIRAAMTTAHSLDEAGQTLMRRAMEGGGRDNASAVLVRVVET